MSPAPSSPLPLTLRARPGEGRLLSSSRVLALLLVAFFTTSEVRPQTTDYARQDPEKIETAEACGECHVSEYEVWKKTPHAEGFKTLHRREAAEKIAGKLDFLLIKRESLCLRCHYTPTLQGEQLRAVSGVSCESCHGAGSDWINVHNDYGGKGFDHTNETPENRVRRIEQSIAAGMRRPSDLYPVVANCFACHTVPEEELVNVGGHPAGSADFELVSWFDKIQHNFLESFKTGDGTANAERPAEHTRRLYVTGRVLDLEYALRGVAAATEKGTYLSSMLRRVRITTGAVRAIARRGDLPEINEILTLVRDADPGLGRREELLDVADRIGQAARRFLDRHDGTRLADLDPLVSGTAGDEVEEVEETDEVVVADAEAVDPSATGGSAAGAAPGAAAPSASPGASSTTATNADAAVQQAVPAVGDRKSRIRPASPFKTLGPGKCLSCHRHSPQNEWWLSDPHSQAVFPFFDEERRNVQIAQFYGVRRDRMVSGDQVCMDCHGTVVSGRERGEVEDGVSCESCHGPAADYLEPHQEGDPALGAGRPGYKAALGLGLSELKDLDVRARTCTGCHYVTDARLISSGHPSGADFDYVTAMSKIRHWESPPAAAGALKAAFDRALGARGGVPQVRLARAAGAAPGPGAAGQAAAGPGGETAGAESRPFRPTTPRNRPAQSRSAVTRSPGAPSAGWLSTSRPPLPAPDGRSPLELPPFPEIDPEASVEDVLLLLKQRLELLYEALRER